jgi:hypothetical protein
MDRMLDKENMIRPECNTLNLGYKISLLVSINFGVTPLFFSP